MDGVRQLIDRGLVTRTIDLVPDADDRNTRREAFCDLLVFQRRAAIGIEHMQNHISLGYLTPGAFDADTLHFVRAIARCVSVTNTGSIDDIERHAFDLDGLGDLVARRAGNWRDDGDIRASQHIE